ncbi:MAG TPA: tyrosine--tRNA ligase [Chitinophagales bacterium]|nr:tyrosine--tRNA ligase [Chitinophagales bacterium]
MNFIEELRWRGLLFDSTPGTEEHLNTGMRSGYVGFDPSAPSLHIGSLVQIMLLVHFQRAGHKPIALVGGATGMIGDPSGKSEERKLLNEETIRGYAEKIKIQLSRFLDFGSSGNAASLENNYEWFREIKVLDFLRDVGKHLTVNYMMAKDSVKSRLESGISFTEFSYQLLQGYDFYWLNQHRDCTMQMGGSDQWGNIVAGIELTRRKSGNELFAVTSQLIMRADGKKLGKTEEGAVWLDAAMTSPYKFYQYWINVTDEDAAKYIRYFSLLSKEEIDAIEAAHALEPGKRYLQQKLAEDITVRVHSREDYDAAVRASGILFGKSTGDDLHSLSNRDFEEIFEGVPTKKLSKSLFENGIDVMKLLVDDTQFFPSKGEARRTIESRGAAVNKQTISLDYIVKSEQLINNRYLVLQKGKKNYFLVIAE